MWPRLIFNEGRKGWAVVLLLASALAFVLWSGSEFAIRLWGMVLQCFGIGAVVHELLSTNRHYRRPSPLAGVRHWFGLWRTTSTDLQIDSVTVSHTIEGGYLHAVLGAATGSVEERLERLEQKADAAEKELHELQEGLMRERSNRTGADRAEANTRQQAIEALDKRVEEVIAGAVPVSLVGVWSLFLGVVLATVSPELARLPGWLGK